MDNILLQKYLVSTIDAKPDEFKYFNKPIVDTNGEVIEENYDQYFDGTYFKKRKGNKKINEVILDYDIIYQFGIGNIVTIVKKNNKYGIIDFKNNIVIPIENEMIRLTGNKFIVINKGICDEYYFSIFSTNSSLIGSYNYLDMKYVKKTNYLIAKNENGYGLIERFSNNSKQIIPHMYDDMFGYDWNCFFVKKNNKWMIVNQKNELILDLEFSRLRMFENNRIIATIDDKEGLLDENFNIVIPIKYPVNSIYMTSITIDHKDDLIHVNQKDHVMVVKPCCGLIHDNKEKWFDTFYERRSFLEKNYEEKILKKGKNI